MPPELAAGAAHCGSFTRVECRAGRRVGSGRLMRALALACALACLLSAPPSAARKSKKAKARSSRAPTCPGAAAAVGRVAVPVAGHAVGAQRSNGKDAAPHRAVL